jgi:hypothetical protein
MLSNDSPVTIDTASLPVLQDLGEVLELGILSVDRELVVPSCAARQQRMRSAVR